MINILIKPNKYNKEIYAVMLQSLLETNRHEFRIFCFKENLDEDCEIQLPTEKIHEIKFVGLNQSLRYNLLKKSVLLNSSAHILMAHCYLPDELERILYLSDDVIINGDIEDFYNLSFEDNYLVVRGQTSRKINGAFHKIGARSENGQYFDARVLLIDLKEMRSHFDVKKEIDLLRDKEPTNSVQGLLNIIFDGKVKYDDDIRNNFRYSICRDAVRNNVNISDIMPKIICCEKRDYYGVGIDVLPWEFLLEETAIDGYKECGIIKSKYRFRESEQINYNIVKTWWFYAKHTPIYDVLKSKMMQRKEEITKTIIKSDLEVKEYLDNQAFFEGLTTDLENVDYKAFQTITYRHLNDYIDLIKPETAVKIMRNIFSLNEKNIFKKRIIKIGFLVYSSSEWQCEELYHKLETNKRFEPMLIIASYKHGTKQDIQSNYIKTCKYFSEKNYHILYLEDLDKRGNINDFDILVYITPFDMLPKEVNLLERNLNQLCVHIPYAYYLENKEDAHYAEDYYDQAVFRLTWYYFASCELEKEIAAKEQSLKGYNIAVSGFPKIDSLIKGKTCPRENFWKVNDSTQLKIIWAPHFNLDPGMNGTFYENYDWFYNFAKEHPEISWIVKPHPRMRIGAIKKGVFKSNAEYDIYISKWNDLNNALVRESGDYYDIFSTSDAMILDSLSFLAEYQFTGKPLLLLQPKELRSMSQLGEKLISVLYTARGNDFDCIIKFINNCLYNNDIAREDRRKFFDEYLNYQKRNGKLATDFIYDKFVDVLL